MMARAFPRSRFLGFDYHGASIERARDAAEEAGVSGNTRFEVASAKTYPGTYDLVAFFDCLHDMGDPEGAAVHVHQSLKPDGTWMIVEPFAHDCLSTNLNPVGRVYYAAYTFVCTPASLSQEVGLGLGAQAGEARLRQGRYGRWLYALPSRRRDAVQYGSRSASLKSTSSKYNRLRLLDIRHKRTPIRPIVGRQLSTSCALGRLQRSRSARLVEGRSLRSRPGSERNCRDLPLQRRWIVVKAGRDAYGATSE